MGSLGRYGVDWWRELTKANLGLLAGLATYGAGRWYEGQEWRRGTGGS